MIRLGWVSVVVLSVLVSGCQFGRSENTSDKTSVAGSYSPTSAVAMAKGLSKVRNFKDEASEMFGIILWSRQEDEYTRFKERIFENSQLNSALQNAKKNGVSVFLDNRFDIGNSWVVFNVSATDSEIIEFLNKSVPVAKEIQANFNRIKTEAIGHGLTLFFLGDVEYYQSIKDRLVTNQRLASAIKNAAKSGVFVCPGKYFYIGLNFVQIDINASDEKIIRFLVGW